MFLEYCTMTKSFLNTKFLIETSLQSPTLLQTITGTIAKIVTNVNNNMNKSFISDFKICKIWIIIYYNLQRFY